MTSTGLSGSSDSGVGRLATTPPDADICNMTICVWQSIAYRVRQRLRPPEFHPVAHSAVSSSRSRRTHRGDAAPAALVRPEIQTDLPLRSGGIGCLEVARDPNDELLTESRRAGIAASSDRRSNFAGGINHERH